MGKAKVIFLSLLLVSTLSACGGGGGDGATKNTGPVAIATATRTVYPGVDVVLDGSSSNDTDGQIVSYKWEQKDNGSPVVTLYDSNSDSARFTAPSLSSEEELEFELTVQDDAGAVSTDMVSVDVLQVFYSDDFNTDDNWGFVNETNNDADWSIQNEKLHQENFLETDANFDNDAFFGTTSYHSGSYAKLTAPSASSLTDYRFSVDIIPKTNYDILRQGNDVGIMFRYQNDDNYYRVSMNARYGFTRFERQKDGMFQTLGVNSIGYVDEQEMTITVEVKDSSIIVWVDGDPIFAVVDDNPVTYGTVALYCQDRAQFDNMLITENSTQPYVAITTPIAYSVALTQDEGNTLPVKAITLNEPSNADVYFSLDGSSEKLAIASGNEYTSQFTGVSTGEHEVSVQLKDVYGEEIDSDINATVGIGGDYYITIGDSITNGVSDEDSSNNDTFDGRTIAIQGYQAPLADALADQNNRPQIVYNEGIGGLTALELSYRIPSILERHPNVSRVLLLIGTNDSKSVDVAIFSNTLSSMARTITNTYGKQLWIAKPPKTYIKDTWTLNTTRNDLLFQYNQEINNLTSSTNDDIYLGPNLFTQFNQSHYADNLHPNDTGYQFMATEWAKKLP